MESTFSSIIKLFKKPYMLINCIGVHVVPLYNSKKMLRVLLISMLNSSKQTSKCGSIVEMSIVMSPSQEHLNGYKCWASKNQRNGDPGL